MKLRDAIAATAGTARQQTQDRPGPLCNPCQQGDHHRCPTVLSEFGGVIYSDFNCPCYRKNEEGHQESFEEAQAAWEERGAHGGRW